MKYIDGFVIVLPKKNVEDYKKMAQLGKRIWMKYGALDYKECVGEDLYPKQLEGIETSSFPKLTNLKPDETVVFSYIVFKSKEHRNEVDAKVLQDPEMNDPQYTDKPMPFEMKKMALGGFEVIVDSAENE